ncbi:MAG: hypothetical protein B7Z08_04770 [Sphingomonadales bacterium 32-68-7]|nr:MAG: hypothetical protein B7Z33_08980 [Sphingomonadales bacterium 12-68-11]OYX09549.1 MAG: hypothetical protein B7Z08_04770 [Sphingomonadales bacterium 32-68-7]
MRFAFLAAAAMMAVPLTLAVPAPASAQPQAADPALAEVLAHPRRAADRARDVHRNPAETLAFFQVRPGMTVVDYMPAGGWFSRVLIPYLGERGTYISLNPELHPELTGYWDMYRNTAERFPAEARGWVGEGGARTIGANTDDVPDALAGTADRFLIFREMHNMRRSGWLHDTLVTARRLLKPDGLLGVEQHRAKADAPADYTLGEMGYLREKDVIAVLDSYGFDLVAKSEINANPKDPANWPQGVWTLPPGYRGTPEGSARRAELDAIGESDRMTLLFRKRP